VTGGQVAEWDPGWVRSAGAGQDGRAELWVAVFTAGWTLMGAAPAPAHPGLIWRDGRLCIDYAPVTVTVRRAGIYQTGVICAVVPGARQYTPLVPVSLGPPNHLRPGETITITDGVLALDFTRTGHPEIPAPLRSPSCPTRRSGPWTRPSPTSPAPASPSPRPVSR
jgi:hypothetical protein